MPRGSVTLIIDMPRSSRREAREFVSSRGAESRAGFDIDRVKNQIVKEMRIRQPVRLSFRKFSPDASSTRAYAGGIGSIHIPTASALRRKMPSLTDDEVRGKQLAQLCEEGAHLAAGGKWGDDDAWTCHKKDVVNPTLRCIRKHLTKRQLQSPYIREKIDILNEAKRSRERCP